MTFNKGVGGGGGGGLTLLGTNSIGSAGPGPLQVGSIPATFKHLKVYAAALQSTRNLASDNLLIKLNNDSGVSHYGAGPAASNMGSQTAFAATMIVQYGGTNAGIGRMGSLDMTIWNYTDTTNPIGFSGLSNCRSAAGGNAGDFPAEYFGGQWQGGAAVNSIQMSWQTGPNFVAGAFMSVYGFN